MSVNPQNTRGDLFVISAPSGAGKTSLVKAVVDKLPDIKFSISYTTRPRRDTEEDGGDYFFVSADKFEAMAVSDGFLEHANVFGYRYATGREHVADLVDRGHDVILEIDWQGAQQVREAWAGCVTVFILPPSRAELERRLRGRKTDSDETIAKRLSESVADMTHWAEFDHVVVNNDFSAAVSDLLGILSRKPNTQRTQGEIIQNLVVSLLS